MCCPASDSPPNTVTIITIHPTVTAGNSNHSRKENDTMSKNTSTTTRPRNSAGQFVKATSSPVKATSKATRKSATKAKAKATATATTRSAAAPLPVLSVVAAKDALDLANERLAAYVASGQQGGYLRLKIRAATAEKQYLAALRTEIASKRVTVPQPAARRARRTVNA